MTHEQFERYINRLRRIHREPRLKIGFHAVCVRDGDYFVETPYGFCAPREWTLFRSKKDGRNDYWTPELSAIARGIAGVPR